MPTAGVFIERNEFPRMAAEIPVKVELAGHHAAENMAAGAADRSRVLSGAMRAGWHAEALEASNEIEWTRFNEYGTRFMDAQPMIQPAAEEAQPKLEAELAGLFEA